jgi:hypothetical protein
MSNQLQVTGEAKIRDIQGPVVANSGVITALDGDANQYVRGDGTLADFPTSTGGGSSVSYYLNSSVSQGTIGGNAYRELSKEPIIGAGTDIAISSNGYIANYITDANDPDVILIPGGNFNCEFYFSVNNNTGNPFFYAELYKYDGTTFTLLGSSVGVPEYINQGTTINPYYFAIPVATATLALTDRLAIRIYVNVAGRTVTLHTENGHLCQVVTTLSKGMVSLNNLTDQSQFITTGTSGTNFNINSSGDTHTFNLPIADATNTGKLSSTDWTTFNNKQPAGNYVTLDTTQTITGSKTFSLATKQDFGMLLKNGSMSALAGYTGIGGGSLNNGIDIILNGSGFTQSLLFQTGAGYNYTFPASSGTIALTSNLSSYVPYTGATTNVDLGTNFLKARTFYSEGSGGGGSYAIKNGTTPSFEDGYTVLSSNDYRLNIVSTVSAATKAVYFGFSGVTATRTYTLPDISGTLALLEGSQTFTGEKVFNNNALFNSVLSVNYGAWLQKGVPSATFSSAFTTLYSEVGAINAVFRDNTNQAKLQFQAASNYTYTFPAATGTLVLGTGTTNYLPKFTGASTLGDSVIQEVSGNIGIGGSPSGSYKFEVTGSGNYSTSLYAKQSYLNTTSAGYNNPSLLINSQSGVSVVLQAIADSSGRLIRFYNSDFNNSNTGTDVRMGFTAGSGNTSFNMQVYTAGETAAGNLILQPSYGNVGIGTSNPQMPLSVQANTGNGAIRLIGTSNASSNNAGIYWYDSNDSTFNGYLGNFSASFDIYNQRSTPMAFYTAGTERMRITSGGNVGIGVPSFASTNERLVVRAASTTSSDFALVVQNSSGFDLLNVRADGLFNTGTRSLSPYNFDPGGRVMYVNSLGQMGSTSSTRESKIHINPITSVDYIMQLNPVSFYHRIQDTETRTYTDEYFDEIKYGFIADEVEKVNLDLVFYNENEDGTKKLAGVEYMSMIAVLTKAIQEQNQLISELSAKVSALENKS